MTEITLLEGVYIFLGNMRFERGFQGALMCIKGISKF